MIVMSEEKVSIEQEVVKVDLYQKDIQRIGAWFLQQCQIQATGDAPEIDTDRYMVDFSLGPIHLELVEEILNEKLPRDPSRFKLFKDMED